MATRPYIKPWAVALKSQNRVPSARGRHSGPYKNGFRPEKMVRAAPTIPRCLSQRFPACVCRAPYTHRQRSVRERPVRLCTTIGNGWAAICVKYLLVEAGGVRKRLFPPADRLNHRNERCTTNGCKA